MTQPALKQPVKSLISDVVQPQTGTQPVATPSPMNPPTTSLIQLQGPTPQQLVNNSSHL